MRRRPKKQPLLDIPDVIHGLDWGERWARKQGYRCIVGVDEVGRGAVAGPVVAAAAMLPEELEQKLIEQGLDDSKRLRVELREILFGNIAEYATIGVGVVSAKRIDEVNILRATLEAMAIAVRQLVEKVDAPPDCLLVDGREPIVPSPLPATPQKTLVQGDGRSVCVAAASVIAKVHRDQLMIDLDAEHPGYGLAGHKGYLCQEHAEAIAKLGPSPIHRLSFRGSGGRLERDKDHPSLFERLGD